MSELELYLNIHHPLELQDNDFIKVCQLFNDYLFEDIDLLGERFTPLEKYGYTPNDCEVY